MISPLVSVGSGLAKLLAPGIHFTYYKPRRQPWRPAPTAETWLRFGGIPSSKAIWLGWSQLTFMSCGIWSSKVWYLLERISSLFQFCWYFPFLIHCLKWRNRIFGDPVIQTTLHLLVLWALFCEVLASQQMALAGFPWRGPNGLGPGFSTGTVSWTFLALLGHGFLRFGKTRFCKGRKQRCTIVAICGSTA